MTNEILVVNLILSFFLHRSYGGNCWSSMVRNGRCTELLSDSMSREECCAAGGSALATAWSAEQMDSGALFFWRVLGGGVPCAACRVSCAGVRCGPGQRCAVRRGRPRCVCAPDCRKKPPLKRGPVCGSDQRTYKSLCRLRKRACRRNSSTLTLAYYGHCQNSCDKIRCGSGKHCVVDQNLRPHCVRCARRCSAIPTTDTSSRAVCGADGLTYPSACHLREAACKKGKAVPVAYKGKCKPHATCGSVRCRDRQQCLTEPWSGAPRCVTCGQRCPRARDPATTLLCGSNHRTYPSWCHMLQDACATGFVVETRHAGQCNNNTTNHTGMSFPPSLNAVLLSDDDNFNAS